jgi:CheY-like chemotaxis protein
MSELRTILLVEDNPGDVYLLKEAWKLARLGGQIIAVSTGQDAIDFLRRQGRHKEALVPDLVILDMNLPIASGRDVLAAIQDDAELAPIPVAVLTTSAMDSDVCAAFGIDPSRFFVKPTQLDDLVVIVKQMAQVALTAHKRGRQAP